MARANKLLELGDKAPEFTLPDAMTGTAVQLSDLLGKPLLLYFARGTWCPTCRRWMGKIRDGMPDLERRGARTVTIMAQSPASTRPYLEKQRYPFPVLADADRRVVKAYGVYVRANFESVNIARPANFVLDADGVIRFMHIASIQVEYASFDEILSVLDNWA